MYALLIILTYVLDDDGYATFVRIVESMRWKKMTIMEIAGYWSLDWQMFC